MIFLVLSVKGVERDGMGHIGTIAKKITGFVKGIGLLAFTILDILRSLVGELWGVGKTSARDIEAVKAEASNSGSQANLPPPYYSVSLCKQFLIGF